MSCGRRPQQKWNHNPHSYAVLCTVLYALKFCSLNLPDAPQEPKIAEWIPPPFFKNRYMETKKLNDLIIQLNKRKNLVLVKFDKQGIKRFKSGTVQHRFDNKPGVANFWKEKEAPMPFFLKAIFLGSLASNFIKKETNSLPKFLPKTKFLSCIWRHFDNWSTICSQSSCPVNVKNS